MAHGHGHGSVGALLGVQPQIRQLGHFRVVGRDRHGFAAFVAHLGEKVGIGCAGLRHVRSPGHDEGGVVPVGRLGHVGLLAPHLRAGGWQVAVPVVKTHAGAANQTQVAAACRIRDHRHGGNRREADDAVSSVFLDGVDVGGSHHLIDLIPARTHKATQAAHALVVTALGVGLDNAGPRLNRVTAQAGFTPAFEQAPAHQRVLDAVGAVQIPAVAGAARAAAWLVVGHVPAGAGVVGLLGFPGHDAAFDIHLPGARAGAVHTVGGAHNLVMRPAVAVGVFPGAVFAGGDTVVTRERLSGLREIA